MKKTTITFFLTLSISVSLLGYDNDAKLVKQTFKKYKTAILEGQGTEAVNWVDQNTIEYYGKMLNLSINADSTEVQELPIIDKLTVLTVRYRIPKEEALEMDGKSFFIYAIDKGMVGKNSVMTLEIGEVKTEGNFANGKMISNGKKTPLYFQFHKEDGTWKIDLTSIFPATNAGLMKMISDNGMTDNEFILQALETLTGSKIKNEIWHPMN